MPRLNPGTIVLILDAAAPYADVLPEREDITYFIGHPCHPPLFNDETDMAARKDYHGGIAAQAIVCALMQGPEEHYAIGAEICETMWSPVIRTHRVTTEQLAILEPGLSEMVAMPFVETMVEAVDVCANTYGIDRQAALDFLIGHLNVEIAMWFGYSPKVPSDAALRLMAYAKTNGRQGRLAPSARSGEGQGGGPADCRQVSPASELVSEPARSGGRIHLHRRLGRIRPWRRRLTAPRRRALPSSNPPSSPATCPSRRRTSSRRPRAGSFMRWRLGI